MKDQIKQTKKCVKPKMYTCEACQYTGTNKNKTNHIRTDKHKNNEKKQQDIKGTHE